MIPVRRVGRAIARNSGMGVRRKGPPLRFSVEAVSSRKLGSRVLSTGEVFMVPLVFRSPHISSQQTATSPLPQETRFLEFSVLGDIKKTLVPSAAIRRPVLS